VVFTDLFRKLLIARQLKMEAGGMYIFDERWNMIPTKILAETFREIMKRPQLIPKIYNVAKESNKKSFAYVMKDKMGLEKIKFVQVGIDISTMSGWGNIQLVNVDVETGTSNTNIYNSPIGSVYGPSKKPVDHIFRGIMAGALSLALGKEIDFIEHNCIAMGKPYCVFESRPTEMWLSDKSMRLKVKEQLGLKVH